VINLDVVMNLLDEKEQSMLYQILMEQDEDPISRFEAEELLDDLYRKRIMRELEETNFLLSQDLAGEDSFAMRKYHRGLTRAMQAEGKPGKLARRYICEEIAEFEKEKIG
jgi:hypothetical protein